MTPVIGTMVQYVDWLGNHLPAMVTSSEGESTRLAVFINDDGPPIGYRDVPFSPQGEYHTWHWPDK